VVSRVGHVETTTGVVETTPASKDKRRVALEGGQVTLERPAHNLLMVAKDIKARVCHFFFKVFFFGLESTS